MKKSHLLLALLIAALVTLISFYVPMKMQPPQPGSAGDLSGLCFARDTRGNCIIKPVFQKRGSPFFVSRFETHGNGISKDDIYKESVTAFMADLLFWAALATGGIILLNRSKHAHSRN